MNVCVRFLSIIFILLFSLGSFAQDRKEELRIRKVRLQDEIQIANRILEEARENRQASVSSLQTLNQKLRIREELLRTIDREVELIEEEIQVQEQEIDRLREEIDTLKAQYAGMIRQAYKTNRESSRLLFILSSEDFAQAVRRVQYLRQYSDYRQRQVQEIQDRQADLEHEIELLNRQKEEKENLRKEKEGELEQLREERNDQRGAIAELQAQEGTIEAQIQQKQSEADRLEREIQRIIAEEVRKARAAAVRQRLEESALEVGLVKGQDFNNRTSNDRLEALIAEKQTSDAPAVEESSTYALTPEAARLARNFEANKGRLPWPVERGIVVGRFGPQPHPANNSIIINNPHIEIGTQAGSDARTAFDGKVIKIIRIPGSPITVIIQHGNYYTHYGNLSEVYVQEGQDLSAREAIGKIYTDPIDNQTVLQFGLWENDALKDPYPWLTR